MLGAPGMATQTFRSGAATNLELPHSGLRLAEWVDFDRQDWAASKLPVTGTGTCLSGTVGGEREQTDIISSGDG
jgi:hypothetical protein